LYAGIVRNDNANGPLRISLLPQQAPKPAP
jgi:hypothetical protein